MINPTLLKTFCALVDTGHFTRTAEALHMTQSGVSQHIRKLEEQLEQPLLARQGKQFTLTDAGTRLYNQGKSVLEALVNLETNVHHDPDDEGLVSIMSPGSVGLKLYPFLLGHQEQNPKLTIDFRFAPTASIETAIANNEIDLGLLTKPSDRMEISCQKIAEEPLYLVTPSAIRKPTWEKLTQLGFINHPDGAHHANALLSENYQEFEHIEQFPLKGFSNQIALILEPVSRGLGFTVLPAHAVSAFIGQAEIKAHRLNHPVSESLYIGQNRSQATPNRIQRVIELIAKQL